MKRLFTMTMIGLAALALSACSRTHMSPYTGVAGNMNFTGQVINPKAPTDDELKEETSGEIAQSTYRRYADTYKEAIPKSLRPEAEQ